MSEPASHPEELNAAKPAKRSRLHLLACLWVAVGFGLVAAGRFIQVNVQELTVSEGVVVVLFALGCSLVFFLIALAALRRAREAAIVAAFASMIFFNYQEIMDWNDGIVLITLMVILLGVSGWVLVNFRRLQGDGWLVVLGLTALVMVAPAAWSVADGLVSNAGLRVEADNQDLKQAEATAKPASKPDIYYIMPEDYAGNITLKETYHYDNSAFTGALKARGFYVPDQAFSNYPFTTTSLASSFNAGLLKLSGPLDKATSREPSYHLIAHPEVAKFLQHEGYSFTQLGSWWGPTETSPQADVNQRYAWDVTLFGHTFYLQEFEAFFIGKTPIEPLLEAIGSWGGQHGNGQLFLNQLQGLEKLAKQQGGQPRLVFAHLLMPHGPNVFNANGGPSDPSLSTNDQYVQQVEYTNKKLLELIDSIRSTPRGKQAVIIMASDEGQFPDDMAAGASPAQVRQKVNTQAAIFFPDQDYSELYPTITPVNHFRVVFNHYFGTSLKLQPDIIRDFAVDENHLYNLQDVTQKVTK